MPANRTNLLQVQLTEAEKRHIKTLAASQGLTLRQATLQAFQTWESQLRRQTPAPNPARGARASAGAPMPGQPKPGAVRRQDRRQTEGAASSAPSSAAIPSLGTASRAWFRRAAQLDWSKCPAAQSVQGKTGKVWVVRGTDAPLAEVLQSVADGHPFLEIAEVFEITLQQLIAVLQFAAENGAPASHPG
jgi:uncharacterized protein (DUF433 family)